MNNEDVILHMKEISKSFDQNLALDEVNFELKSHEILGLLGGNGAGKTTLMNVLYGLYKQDTGDIQLHGKKIDIPSPKSAIHHGIGMVHQHFLQINSYPVIHNIVLGTNVKKPFTLNLEEEAKEVVALAKRFGIDIDPFARIEELPMGTRQKVEILKALYRGIEILILDEPTTNLTPQEVDDLFVTLRTMVNEGLSIVFITHKLREVLSVCDRISVLREGRNVLVMDRGEASEEALVKGMVGDDMDVENSIIFSKEDAVADINVGKNPILETQDLRVVNEEKIETLRNVSFDIHEGEIFGIAGVAGNGQRELAEVIVAVQPLTEGEISLSGAPSPKSTGDVLKMGVTYIPEDRHEDGYLPRANVAQNLILGVHRQEPYSKNGFINWNTVFDSAREQIVEYNIKTSGPSDAAANLSGGNIQRLMIARAFSQGDSKLVVAHNPTRGLDIRSIDFVYEKLLEQKKAGAGVLLLSENLDELLLMCDRIGVMYRGELVGIQNRGQFEKYEIGRMMSGVKDA
jgi:general nucleoside transport system ATP-binding protein